MIRCVGAAAWALALAGLATGSSHWPEYDCAHCDVGPGFEELLDVEQPLREGEIATEVQSLFNTHIEVIPLTTDIGGFEPPTLHERLSQEVVRAWADFKDRFDRRDFSGLDEEVVKELQQGHAGALNDGFFKWQKFAFEQGETTWPELNSLPKYQRLRQIVAAMRRRYLERSGLARAAAQSLNFSTFNWGAVSCRCTARGSTTVLTHTLGCTTRRSSTRRVYYASVFYAQVGDGAGKIRFSDPRGHSLRFGNSLIHTPRSGELILFPSWLGHMATVMAPSVHGSEGDLGDHIGIIYGSYRDQIGDLRVAISLNVYPESGPLPSHQWYTDPVSDMRFSRRSSFDPKELDL